jgi:hypothetical protein
VAASLCGAARVARAFSTVSALRRRTLFDAVEIRVGMSVCMDQESRTGHALRAIRTVDSVTSSPGALAESHDHESRPATNKGTIEFVAVRADDLEGISHERLLVRSDGSAERHDCRSYNSFWDDQWTFGESEYYESMT